ncbi:MAG: FixH family protein [Gemmatimonadaceae bacterium]
MPNAPSRGRGRAWPFAMAGILLAGIASNAAFVVLASSDPAAAVEPDYYRKAVAWDQEMAQDQRNIALGWSAHAALYPGAKGTVGRLELTLADSLGRPLSGATVRALVMHNARAAAVQTVTLRDAGAGHYTAFVSADRPGLWEIRLSVERNSQRFTARERIQVVAPT